MLELETWASTRVGAVPNLSNGATILTSKDAKILRHASLPFQKKLTGETYSSLDISSPLANTKLVVAAGAPAASTTGQVTGQGNAVDVPAVGDEVDAVDATAAAAVETPAVTCWGEVTQPRAG